MNDLPLLPINYRLEHRQEGQSSYILAVFITEQAARVATNLAVLRLEKAGASGAVVLID